MEGSFYAKGIAWPNERQFGERKKTIWTQVLKQGNRQSRLPRKLARGIMGKSQKN